MGMIKKWCKRTSNGPCMDSKLKKLLEGPCIWARFLGKGEQLLGVTFIFFPELQQRQGRCEVALWEGITAVQWSSAGVTAPWPDEPPACGSCVLWPAWCQLCSRGLFVTAVFFFFLCGTGTISRRWWIKREGGKWLTQRLSWWSTGPMPTAVCGDGWVPVALWFLAFWDDCNRATSSWGKSSLMGRPPKVRWHMPWAERGVSETKKNLLFGIFFVFLCRQKTGTSRM